MARQRRWRGAVAATIVLVVAGLADGNGVLLLGAIVPLWYVAVGTLTTVTAPDGIVARRQVSPTPAPPGRPVTVTLEVTNESDRTLPDVRLADGVPEKLAVLEGSPRTGTTLEPGETVTVEYLVVARRGTFAFDPPQLRIRGFGASAVATATPTPSGDRRLVCRLDADAPPLETVGTDRVGQLTTDRPGEGIAFHSTREYRPDDPADRIDWRHYAKRGSLATVDYERQVSATVVLVVDARAPNRVVAGRGRPTAVERGAYAATRALTDLLGHGHDVGVAVIGVDGDGPTGLEWLEPAGGREQRSRALDAFRTATDAAPPDGSADETADANRNAGSGTDDDTVESWLQESEEPAERDGKRNRKQVQAQIRRLVDLSPSGTQLALFSPLLDDVPLEAVETWRGASLPVVVLSPDVVPENTVSGQYAQIQRRTRLARCQATGARTFDWRRGTPLPLLIEQAFSADARLSSARLTAGTGETLTPTGHRSGSDSGPGGDG
ncbi:DUF58 domain-containing protein [Halopiger djelfimassiliensis]|uniref:DUF58 domain-containing protein n=1 Tax=Halopiger djelfimassiliensis TaxID=1293047 RepID=UPI000AD3A1E6|nr:DUF58 domain-containing protein [Halopiger djelfimassiliensis]